MRAGKLDRVIVVETRGEDEKDDMGAVQPRWEPFATVRAQVIQASTDEFLSGFGETTETAIIFRIRWLEGLTTAHRVTYQGDHFNVREIKEIGRNKGMDVRCVGRTPA